MSSSSNGLGGWRGLALAACVVGGLVSANASANVFQSRNEALETAFPEADRVENETFVLRDDQVTAIERISRGPLASKLARVSVGMRGDQIVGYAVIDVHEVRTHREALMVVLSPDGEVRSVRVLAFHEPLEYLPSDRWYSQFGEKSLAVPLRVGGDIHGVVGATLTTHATARGVRRALAYYEVLVQNGH